MIPVGTAILIAVICFICGGFAGAALVANEPDDTF